MMNQTTLFSDFNLPETLQAGLDRVGFTIPTPIQKEAIPPALAGRDVIGSAQTGSGKTAAFVIPILAKLAKDGYGNALILTPTRELATQVFDVITKILPKKTPVKTALLIGGEPIPKQLKQLRLEPRIIVGTPGRVNDHIKREKLRIREVDFLVLDEIDRMLDMGFGIQIDEIVRYVPAERQTLMFSATLPAKIEKLAKQYLREPIRIIVGENNQPAAKIRQEIFYTKHADKYHTLLAELNERQGSVVVFVKTKRSADELARQLQESEHRADAIHGDLRQRERDRVIQKFRDKAYRIMVATDVAARGLDVPHIEHVINFDLPQCPEDYIHRIGRTGRAGAEGSALSFVSPSERGLWQDIARLLNEEVTAKNSFAIPQKAKRTFQSNAKYTNRQAKKKSLKYHP